MRVRTEAAFKYFVTGSLASSLMLAGAWGLYIGNGSTNQADHGGLILINPRVYGSHLGSDVEALSQAILWFNLSVMGE